MDRLDIMRLFVRVADTGSFSKAARTTGVSQSTASKQIAALERRLGTQLLNRTSRGLSLTEGGQDFYESVIQLLGELEDAESRLARGQVSPFGRLRVALSAGIGRMYVVPRLPEFFARYPNITIDLDISERHVNLIEEGIDVAIRIGNLSDSGLLVRRIGSMEAITVAAPGYIERFGEPLAPKDIEHHACVAFMFQGAPRVWEFKGPSGPISIVPSGPVRTNDAEHIRAAVRAGLGICHNSSWLFASDLASGDVVRLLKGFAPSCYPISAVCPSRRHISSKVKVFIDFLAQICAAERTLMIR